MPLVPNANMFVRDKDSEHTVSKIICVSVSSACGRQLFAMTTASTHFQAGETKQSLIYLLVFPHPVLLSFLYVNLEVKCFLAFGHSPALTKTVTTEIPLFQ